MSVARLASLRPSLTSTPPRIYELLRSEAPMVTLLRPLRNRIHTSHPRYQGLYTQRYGSATELPPPAKPAKTSPSTDSLKNQQNKQEIANGPASTSEKAATSSQQETLPTKKPLQGVPVLEGESGQTAARNETAPSNSLIIPPTPLGKILHVGGSPNPQDQDVPHLHAPPYVHHFDTFNLVNALQDGGYSKDQAITVMKAVRSLLADNVDLAKDALVSKADVENEAYLFRAACDELKTEISNNRKTSNEKLRSERAHLQHEVDILSQKVNNDTLGLKDQIKGMFDDRRMLERSEQRDMEAKIQEINYKISVILNSEMKGEIEGLRWFLTRRAAIFIASMAVLILVALRYNSYMSHLQTEERKRMDETKAAPVRSMSTQTADETTDGILAASGVSLG